MWCTCKGYNIENIAGDGNCLYASPGRNRKLTGNKVRPIIHDRSYSLWTTHMEHDVDGANWTSSRNKLWIKQSGGIRTYCHVE
eukprot:11132505-Heterocapsa_arctica.AAC.1